MRIIPFKDFCFLLSTIKQSKSQLHPFIDKKVLFKCLFFTRNYLCLYFRHLLAFKYVLYNWGLSLLIDREPGKSLTNWDIISSMSKTLPLIYIFMVSYQTVYIKNIYIYFQKTSQSWNQSLELKKGSFSNFTQSLQRHHFPDEYLGQIWIVLLLYPIPHNKLSYFSKFYNLLAKSYLLLFA